VIGIPPPHSEETSNLEFFSFLSVDDGELILIPRNQHFKITPQFLRRC
jgi:hypothetical protein